MVDRWEIHRMSSPSSLANPVADTELWASRIASHASLPDERLNTRLGLLLAALSAKPCDGLPQACGCSSQAQAAYRFLPMNASTPMIFCTRLSMPPVISAAV